MPMYNNKMRLYGLGEHCLLNCYVMIFPGKGLYY